MTTCTLTCKCGATTTGKVIEDSPEINFTDAEPKYPDEWEGGDPKCQHEDYEISNIEYDDGE